MPSDGQGYARLANFPMLNKGNVAITIDDYTIKGTFSNWDWSRGISGSSLRTYAGTDIQQLRYRGSDTPLNMEPFSASFNMLFRWQDDMTRLMFAASIGQPVQANFNFPIVDHWSLKAAGTNQFWRTSRKTVWDNVTYTHTTHPPRAFIDGTEQTIVTSGTPTAGEVLVPNKQTADFEYEALETPALTGVDGNFLWLFYWPELRIRFSQESYSIPAENGWIFNAQFTDVLSGTYSLP